MFGAVSLPLETVMLPLFASEFFGNKSFDKTVGIFASASYAVCVKECKQRQVYNTKREKSRKRNNAYIAETQSFKAKDCVFLTFLK